MSCPVCEGTTLSGWRFPDGDRICPLCGEQILHLHCGQVAPERGRPPEVWLYLRRDLPLSVTLSWRRGPNSVAVQGWLRPSLNGQRSQASYGDPQRGYLPFALAEQPP